MSIPRGGRVTRAALALLVLGGTAAALAADDACLVEVREARASVSALWDRFGDDERAAVPGPLRLRIEDALDRAAKVADRREQHCQAADAGAPDVAATEEHLAWALAVAERALVQLDLELPLVDGKRQPAPAILYPFREPGSASKIGFLDGSGGVRIPARFEAYQGPRWRSAEREHPLRGAWARVKTDGRWAYTDGQRRLEPPGQTLGPFSEGRAAVGSGGVFVYINEEGQAAFPGTFLRAEPFSDGLAVVATRRGVGFVDEKGKLAIPDRWVDARRFSEGKAPVRGPEGWMYVDRKGEPLFGGRIFDDAYPFLDERARVRAQAEALPGQARWAFLDARGRLAIPGPFEDARDFREGAAAVRVDGGWTHVDQGGRLLYTERFLDVGPFVDGLAYATTDRGEGVIDRWGRFVRKPSTGTATPHPRGVILVEQGDERGYVDWSGRFLWRAGATPKGWPGKAPAPTRPR